MLAILLCLLLITLPISEFVNKVRLNEIAIADQTLLTAANNGVTLIQSVFSSYMTTIKNIALLYEQNDDLTGAESLRMLQSIAEQNGYERLAVDFSDGRTYTSDGNLFNMAYMGYLDKLERGESFVTDVVSAIADGVNVISFITPLYDNNGAPIAGLRLTMDTTAMTDAIGLTLFGGEGYYHLVDENGHYVAAENTENALLMDRNFFDAIANMDYHEGYSINDIQKAFSAGESGFARYSAQGSTRYAYCQPVGINNWVLMTIVPQETITKAERQNIFFASIMAFQLLCILSIIFAYIYFLQRKAAKAAILNDKCFRALSKQSGKVIFEWDFASGKIVSMDNFKEIFGRDIATHSSAEDALNAGMVHPGDREVFENVFTEILGGNNVENIRFRVKNASDDYHWCTLSGIVIFDHNNRPYKAVGTMADIEAEVANEVQMKLRSEVDPLTGLYNKSATELYIRNLLKDATGSCALMIIDIDDFKNVNDSMGHQFGDRVLVDFAEILKPLSNDRSIVGRIGGDEFFVFFGNYRDNLFIYEQVERICQLFAKTYTDGNSSCSVSTSIGISFFPGDAPDFETLYKHADIALYRIKSSGKNSYTAYDASFGNEVATRTKIDTTVALY